ncbi:RNA polymerase sigma factor [Peribacillus loiseleuriae]|uniref:RNA polymerase sigma factor n=1 Tax=Peribacillus loiseleuriae TaxID=1679170 RepID=UPI0037F809A3
MFKKRKIEKAFIQFVTENEANLYRFAYNYVKNQQDALDVVQESIRKGLCSIHKIEDVSVIKSWMYRIVINTSIDSIRKHKKVQPMESEVIELHLLGGTDKYENIDLKNAIESLPYNYHVIIFLRFFEDLKIEEIAKVLEENANTIKTRLYRALKLLRVELEDGFQEDKMYE